MAHNLAGQSLNMGGVAVGPSNWATMAQTSSSAESEQAAILEEIENMTE